MIGYFWGLIRMTTGNLWQGLLYMFIQLVVALVFIVLGTLVSSWFFIGAIVVLVVFLIEFFGW